MNQIMGLGQITIATGMGNQGNGENHTTGRITADRGNRQFVVTEQGNGQPIVARGGIRQSVATGQGNQVSFIVGPGEQNFGLQIWKNYADVIHVFLRTPFGVLLGPFTYGSGLTQTVSGETRILFYYGEPVPYSVNQEIYITFLPRENRLDEGEWQVIFEPVRIVSGIYEMWLPDGGLVSGATQFLMPSPDLTQTIPSTADRVISVGAYDSNGSRMASFSGRGPVDASAVRIKPDLVAPGVNIESCAPGGGYTIKSGTSMAVPFVTGSAALMMEWGIVNGNDNYLYGEKIKAYLRRGARRLPGFEQYPNEVTGYGKLCLEDSFPERIG